MLYRVVVVVEECSNVDFGAYRVNSSCAREGSKGFSKLRCVMLVITPKYQFTDTTLQGSVRRMRFDFTTSTPGYCRTVACSGSCASNTRLNLGFVSYRSKSPPHFVHKHNLSIGYEREYQLLGRVVPHDAVGDPARIRLLSSDRGDELTVYGSKDLLDTH